MPSGIPSLSARWLVIATALVFTTADHFYAHVAYLERLNTPTTLLTSPPRPREPSMARPLARRVVVLFLDGLGFSAATYLPNLGVAARSGARRELEVPFPSFTYPAVATFASGVPALYSGLRLNHLATDSDLRICARLPTVVDEAQRKGIAVRVSDGGWADFRAILDPRRRASSLTRDAILAADGRSLDWIYFGEVDRAGHRYGGASREYRAAARRADALAGQVLEALDPSQDALLIVSDHGHLPRGGHGGAEPEIRRAILVATGAGIRPTTELTPRPLEDVAPTLAVLLGLPPPEWSLGRPMTDLLAQPGDAAARALAATLTERLAVENELTPGAATPATWALVARLHSGDAAALGPGERLLDAMASRRTAEYPRERACRARPRLVFAFVMVLLLAAGAVCLHRSRQLPLQPRDVLPTVIYSAIFAGLYFAAGYHVSWSIPRGEIGFLIETALYGGIAVAVALLFSRRARFGRLTQETLVMTFAFGLPYLLVAAWVGLDARYLAAPIPSYLVPLLATVGFYAHGSYALVLLAQTIRRHQPPEPAQPSWRAA